MESFIGDVTLKKSMQENNRYTHTGISVFLNTELFFLPFPSNSNFGFPVIVF